MSAISRLLIQVELAYFCHFMPYFFFLYFFFFLFLNTDQNYDYWNLSDN